MRRLMLLFATAALLLACQQKQPVRFTTSSAEIEAYKKGIAAYEAQDWDTWQGAFADTAKVYYNTTESSTVEETKQGHLAMIETLSSYEFDKEKMFIEQVIDDDGKTWVNFWGLWKGTFKANGKTLEIPVHLSTQFVNGKIVEEYGFWDMSSYVLEIQAIQAAAQAAAEAQDTVSEE